MASHVQAVSVKWVNGVEIHDKTTEARMTVSGGSPQALLWKGLPILSKEEGLAHLFTYFGDVQNIEVIDGYLGRIRIIEKRFPHELGAAPKVVQFEFNQSEVWRSKNGSTQFLKDYKAMYPNSGEPKYYLAEVKEAVLKRPQTRSQTALESNKKAKVDNT